MRDVITMTKAVVQDDRTWKKDPESMNVQELRKLSKELEKKMRQAAAELNFEDAAKYRDRMSEVLRMISDSTGGHA